MPMFNEIESTVDWLICIGSSSHNILKNNFHSAQVNENDSCIEIKIKYDRIQSYYFSWEFKL